MFWVAKCSRRDCSETTCCSSKFKDTEQGSQVAAVHQDEYNHKDKVDIDVHITTSSFLSVKFIFTCKLDVHIITKNPSQRATTFALQKKKQNH